MLLDSNIIIYAFQPEYDRIRSFLEAGDFSASAITQLEVVGYWRLSEFERHRFNLFFNGLNLLSVTTGIIHAAISLRQQRSIGLADAIIAATALVHKMPLITHNTQDFRWIEGLELIDPLVAK